MINHPKALGTLSQCVVLTPALDLPCRCSNDPKVERRLQLMFNAAVPKAASDKSSSDVGSAELGSAAVSTAETAATAPASSEGAVGATAGAQSATAHTAGRTAGASGADTMQQAPAGNSAALVYSSAHLATVSANTAAVLQDVPKSSPSCSAQQCRRALVLQTVQEHAPQKRQRMHMSSADPAATSTSTAVQEGTGPADGAGGQHTPLSMPQLLLPAQQQHYILAPQQQQQQMRTAETAAGAQVADVVMPMQYNFVVADDQDWEQLLALIDRNDEAGNAGKSAFAGQAMQQAWGPGTATAAPSQQQQEMFRFNSTSSVATSVTAQQWEVTAQPGALGGSNWAQALSMDPQGTPHAAALAAQLPSGCSPMRAPSSMARVRGATAAAPMATAAGPMPHASMGWTAGMVAGTGSACAAPSTAYSACWRGAAAAGYVCAGQPWSAAEAGEASAGTGAGISTQAQAAAAGAAAGLYAEATGLFSCIQTAQQAVAVTNRAMQYVEDVAKHVQKQQSSAGGAVGAFWDWLQAAWLIEALPSQDFAAPASPASIAAAMNDAKAAAPTAHNPRRLALLLSDCLARLCAGTPAAYGESGAAQAFVCKLLQLLQHGLAAVQRFAAAAAPGAAVSCMQLLQEYVASLMAQGGPGKATDVVSTLWALAQLL